jgi:hypothetical protein
VKAVPKAMRRIRNDLRQKTRRAAVASERTIEVERTVSDDRKTAHEMVTSSPAPVLSYGVARGWRRWGLPRTGGRQGCLGYREEPDM